jgi:hypothetical protein
MKFSFFIFLYCIIINFKIKSLCFKDGIVARTTKILERFI